MIFIWPILHIQQKKPWILGRWFTSKPLVPIRIMYAMPLSNDVHEIIDRRHKNEGIFCHLYIDSLSVTTMNLSNVLKGLLEGHNVHE